MKKKVFILYYLFFFSFTFIYPQTEEKSDCETNLEDIFKVHDFMIRSEAIRSLYKDLDIKNSIIREKDGLLWRFKKYWDDYSMAIKGVPMVFENYNDSIFEVVKIPILDANSKKCEMIESFSEDQMNIFLKQISYTPEKAFKEYQDYVRDIKLEKDKYLKCIDAELAKGDLSEYAKKYMVYTYISPTKPMLGLPYSLTKLDFLKVFKEFVFNIDNEVLPLGIAAYVYLNCNCHIPISLYMHEVLGD